MGIPTFYLQSLAREFAERLSKRGMRVPTSPSPAAFLLQGQVFKAIAIGAPYFRAVCMGGALMIHGMVGKNIQKWIGGWRASQVRLQVRDDPTKQLFVTYEELAEKYGREVEEMPLGAMGIYTYAQRFQVGRWH